MCYNDVKIGAAVEHEASIFINGLAQDGTGFPSFFMVMQILAQILLLIIHREDAIVFCHPDSVLPGGSWSG